MSQTTSTTQDASLTPSTKVSGPGWTWKTHYGKKLLKKHNAEALARLNHASMQEPGWLPPHAN